MSLHQDVCDAYNINRYELAEKLGVSKTTLDSWSDENRMTKVTRLALELMLENHHKTKLLSDLNSSLSKIVFLDGSNDVNTGIDDERKKIASRIRHILNEYNLSLSKASKRLEFPDFEYLNKVLKAQIYPSFDFLKKFSDVFHISNEWLEDGKGHPFDLEILGCRYFSQLKEKKGEFNKFYIVNCTDNIEYTKLVAEDKLGRFDIFERDFCIGDRFIMSGIECSDLFELYSFYTENRGSYVSLVTLEPDDYKKLLSRDYYAGNILKCGRGSCMLYDLFDLDYYNQERYGDFFVECTNIIKEIKERKINK